MEKSPYNNEFETKNLIEFFVIFKFLLYYAVNPFDRFHDDLLKSVDFATTLQEIRRGNITIQQDPKTFLLASVNESEYDDPTFEFQIFPLHSSIIAKNIVPFKRKLT
jgi:hypothetical protein